MKKIIIILNLIINTFSFSENMVSIFESIEYKKLEKFCINNSYDTIKIFKYNDITTITIKIKNNINNEKYIRTKENYIKDYNNILKFLKLGNFSHLILYKDNQEKEKFLNLPNFLSDLENK